MKILGVAEDKLINRSNQIYRLSDFGQYFSPDINLKIKVNMVCYLLSGSKFHKIMVGFVICLQTSTGKKCVTFLMV